MATRVLRVALTGSIATGKSHCLRRFVALGVPCVDADRLAHDAVAPRTDGLRAVVERFGPEVLDVRAAGGRLDRAALARRVFADAAARRDLEAIIHPRVYAAIVGWFARLDASPVPPPFGIADVPLLYETGRAADFDRVIVAACRPDQQLARLRERDGLSEADAQARIGAQWPIDRKAARADYVVDTSGERDDTDRQVDELVGRLAADAGAPGR